MKSIMTLTAIAGLSLCMACNNGDNKKDSVDSAKDLNNEAKSGDKDTAITTQGNEVNKDVATFAVKAAAGGMMEVEFGKLAQEKATRKDVKDFGAMMVKHHGEMNEKLKAKAMAKGINLPTELSDDAKKEWKKLNEKTGKDFDDAYLKLMEDDHEKDLKEFKDAAANLQDNEIKMMAQEGVSVVQSHLNQVKALRDKK